MLFKKNFPYVEINERDMICTCYLKKISHMLKLMKGTFFFNCSGGLNDESLALFCRLKRSLPPGPEPLRLYAQNFDVELWNSDCLLSMDGKKMIHIYHFNSSTQYPLPRGNSFCFLSVYQS